MIELVDFNDVYGKGIEKATEATKKTRRSRGGAKKADAPKAEVAAPVEEASPAVVEEPKTEEKAAE